MTSSEIKKAIYFLTEQASCLLQAHGKETKHFKICEQAVHYLVKGDPELLKPFKERMAVTTHDPDADYDTEQYDDVVIASLEADTDKACRGDWTSKKYYKIDIQKMMKNPDIQVRKGIEINNFSDLLTDQKYTNLCGHSTGEAYIDVGKFANEMILRLRSIWQNFVDSNHCKWTELRTDLQSNQVLQTKLNAVNKALDVSDLEKLGWYNINDEYFPSKYEAN